MRFHRCFAYVITTFFCTVMLAGSAFAGAGGGCGTGSHSVPEPASLALLAAGVGGILLLRSRRSRK